MTILLFHGTDLTSRLIRWQTRSKYSHAAIRIAGTGIFEAVTCEGVRLIPDLTPAYQDVTVDEFAINLAGATGLARAFLAAQLGKPYDYTMVARFLTRRQESRRTSGKWFCSELVYAATIKYGARLLRDTAPWEVSPALLARSPFLSFFARHRLPQTTWPRK
jgi:uncharacterized protein YycO